MNKFVNAEDVKDLLNGLDSLPWENEVEDMVNSLIVSDVVEVKHGVWGDTGIEHLDLIYSGYKCSECGEIICGNKFPYCPNCGAKMDGE